MCHIVVVVFNDLNLLVLFVSELIEVFFLFKKRYGVDKKYPISSRKTIRVDRKYPLYTDESNFFLKWLCVSCLSIPSNYALRLVKMSLTVRGKRY